MKSISIYLLLLSATVLALALNSCSKQSAEAANSANVHVIADVTKSPSGAVPDFSWNDGNNDIKFSEFTKGKVVFLNFWGTWCGPCRKEIPDIIEISKELNGKDFIVVGIPLERDRTTDAMITKVSEFVAKTGIPYVNVIDAEQKLAQAFGGIEGVPTTYIINDSGEVIERIVGMRDKNTFMTSIRKANPKL